MKQLTSKKAQYFAHADGVDRFALVALDPDDPNEIIVVVRFHREAGTDRAEYAALVEDRWQGRGLGRRLTQRLIDAAHERGIRHLYGLVMHGNSPMLTLLRTLGLPKRERREGDSVFVELYLGEACPRRPLRRNSSERRGQKGARRCFRELRRMSSRRAQLSS